MLASGNDYGRFWSLRASVARRLQGHSISNLWQSPTGGHGRWNPFNEPCIGNIDVGTSRKDSFARPCEIIFRRTCPGFSIIDSRSRSYMHPGERTRCSCFASDSSCGLPKGHASAPGQILTPALLYQWSGLHFILLIQIGIIKSVSTMR